MRKWILAGAAVIAVSFLAEAAPAQETIPAPTTVISSPSSTGRVGLLQRMRDRRMGTTIVSSAPMTTTATLQSSSSGVIQAQAITPATTTQPALSTMQVVEQPRGLMGRMRARRGITTTVPMTPMTTTTPSSGIQQAQALTPSTTPAVTTTTLPVVETRQGLLSRLRMRR